MHGVEPGASGIANRALERQGAAGAVGPRQVHLTQADDMGPLQVGSGDLVSLSGSFVFQRVYYMMKTWLGCLSDNIRSKRK